MADPCAPATGDGDAVDCASLPYAAGRAYANLFAYLRRTQGDGTAHLRPPEPYSPDGRLRIDAATRRNLELLTSTSGEARGSLVSVLDRAVTAMGRRLVRRWIVEPLADVAAIRARLDAVETLVDDAPLRDELREALKRVGDLERTVGRVGSRSAGPRDLVRLADSLDAVAALVALAEDAADRLGTAGDLAAALSSVDPVEALRDRIRATLVDEPPAVANRGGVVRDGVHDEVDRLRSVRSDGKGWIAAFEAEERARTGIPSLKVGFNKVFGFFIEVTRANQDRVPANYTRKQTLANAERYITEDLKKRESEVLGAEERLATLEAHLFDELLVEAARLQALIGETAAALARVDTLAGLAEVASRNGYTRPLLHGRADLVIEGGRHPVVEARTDGRFVSNDCRLGGEHALVAVITGPNMAGKSTYLRQVALVALLAHCGSFVPAARAEIPLLDRIFTRIGASDDLSAGQSTFMVEMSETATILENMTDRSLVVLDEIGRGTSTFDGISIAWAVAEAMLRARVKTLFATHYHELAGLAASYPEAANFSVAVRRYRGDVIFLYRVVEGPTSGSYGIEVARLAGVPDAVIDRAREMLARFENGEGPPGSTSVAQMSLFAAKAPATDGERPRDALVVELARADVETLSPLEALNLLASLVARAKDAS